MIVVCSRVRLCMRYLAIVFVANWTLLVGVAEAAVMERVHAKEMDRREIERCRARHALRQLEDLRLRRDLRPSHSWTRAGVVDCRVCSTNQVQRPVLAEQEWNEAGARARARAEGRG